MADELTLEIVTPEQMAFRGVVDEVTIPGTEGEFGVLKGHAPLLASVDYGELSFLRDHAKTRYAVHSGYAEVSLPTLFRCRPVHRLGGKIRPRGRNDPGIQGDPRGQARRPARTGLLHGRRDRRGRGKGEEARRIAGGS